MVESGIFDGQRFELLDGDIVNKRGQNPPHASAIQLLLALLVSFFGAARVRIQLPIDVAPKDRERNEPEPDVAVLAQTKPEFALRHPRGDELLLVVEVADTSLRTDLSFKRDLYARAGVPEYWVLDLNGRCLIAHRSPHEGTYRKVVTRSENDSVSIESLPDATIAVAGLLPVNPLAKPDKFE